MAVAMDEAPRPTTLRRLVADPEQGPLPALMLVLTVLTGMVDAVSILSLGRVFVANMTGNVVFVGFALAGAPGFLLSASLSALAGFLIGAAGGGRLAERAAGHRGRLLTVLAAVELALVLAALAAAAAARPHLDAAEKVAIAALLAIAMGAQNAVVRQLKVFDLTTTVLTMTLTGIAADSRSDRFALVRRILAVLAMLAGAAAGALLVLDVSMVAALGLGAGLLAVVLVVAGAASRRPVTWS
jgi:uncharacterized membrane protein YoaK (UPF0700 family)